MQRTDVPRKAEGKSYNATFGVLALQQLIWPSAAKPGFKIMELGCGLMILVFWSLCYLAQNQPKLAVSHW